MRNPEGLYKRRAVLAGSFYPASGQEIKEMFEAWAPERKPMHGLCGLILPHAGYIYSGRVAALGYSLIPKETSRLILLGPSHHYPLRGIAVWNEGVWETPLGDVGIDYEVADALIRLGVFHPDIRPHLPEHSLEVHAPFIKHFLPEAQIVPLLVGTMDSHELEEAAEVLRRLLDGRTLIIASSDLYHGYSYEECIEQDKETLSRIKALNGKGFLLSAKERRVMACGDMAIALLLEVASGLPKPEAEILLYTNSSEVTGASSGYVVGYAAVAIRSG
ncbi:MAG: AmmeMemoRadiSam system protein B [candidate division WOR-3 bacterium]